jgi:hypothetical protein
MQMVISCLKAWKHLYCLRMYTGGYNQDCHLIQHNILNVKVKGCHARVAVSQRIANETSVFNMTSMKSEGNSAGFRSFHVLGHYYISVR